MNNIELQDKVLEILKEENYFELIMKAKEFEPEYKSSDFYKATKKPLMEVLKESKVFYALQLKDLSKYIQEVIDGLSLEKVNSLLDQIGMTFGQENNDIIESLEAFKDLKN